MDELVISAAFWLLLICAFRSIIFMQVHPHIAGIYKTFKVVGMELINFAISFGVIYSFFAFVAFIRYATSIVRPGQSSPVQVPRIICVSPCPTTSPLPPWPGMASFSNNQGRSAEGSLFFVPAVGLGSP